MRVGIAEVYVFCITLSEHQLCVILECEDIGTVI